VAAGPALYYLRTFHVAASEGSFTRAARLLALSQPSVSAHIRALERYYRAPLFEVRRRRVHLTAEGQALLALTQRIFNLVEETDRAIAATQGVERGYLALEASPTIGVYLLPPSLSRYRRTYPGVTVELTIGPTEHVAASVLADRVPLGLVEAPVAHADLHVEPFGHDDMVLIAPRDHPWAAAGAVEPKALQGLPLLRREAGSAIRATVDAMLHDAGLAAETDMVLGSTEALKQAVVAGAGLAWVPRAAAAREIAAGEVAVVRVRGVDARRTLSLIWVRQQRLPPAAAAFLDLLRQDAISGSCCSAASVQWPTVQGSTHEHAT
jgi:DNA-binding transcriptional LysR family regulator